MQDHARNQQDPGQPVEESPVERQAIEQALCEDCHQNKPHFNLPWCTQCAINNHKRKKCIIVYCDSLYDGSRGNPSGLCKRHKATSTCKQRRCTAIPDEGHDYCEQHTSTVGLGAAPTQSGESSTIGAQQGCDTMPYGTDVASGSGSWDPGYKPAYQAPDPPECWVCGGPAYQLPNGYCYCDNQHWYGPPKSGTNYIGTTGL
jgi:hypothetical protein